MDSATLPSAPSAPETAPNQPARPGKTSTQHKQLPGFIVETEAAMVSMKTIRVTKDKAEGFPVSEGTIL